MSFTPATFLVRPGARVDPGAGYQWPQAKVVATAVLGADGPLAVRLVLGGVPAAQVLRVACTQPRVFRLGLEVPAGVSLQMEVVSGTAQGSLTLEVWDGHARCPAPVEAQVRWRSGPAELLLYRYDPATALFTPEDPAWLAGRAVLTSEAELTTLTLDSVEVLRVEAGITHVRSLRVAAGFPAGPRLEFWLGDHLAAAVSAAGELAVPALIVGDPLFVGSETRFVFPAAPVSPAMAWQARLMAALELKEDL